VDRNKEGKFLKGHKSFRMKRIGVCSVDGCGKPILSRGFCGQHYQRNKKYGNPIEQYHWLGRPKSRKEFNCEICKKIFYRRPSEILKSKPRFCSRECAFKGMKGQLKNLKPIDQRIWRTNRKGYLETTIRRRRILKHRWLMEKYLKRELRNDEFVHHLNGNKQDNSIENLIILNSGLHSKIHRGLAKENKILKALLLKIINDPTGLNVNWVKNVYYFYNRNK